ncbi:MAG: hypothetical protein BZY87_03220 [SAR202 cluster bacterium Io17-Chloro-G6]|nr:MAG: hypothetical protein BZY87_03220 [SAR202 cluster bacterium Io17-Chloro-G6]
MQFMSYFELNENISEAERLAGVAKVMEKGLYPPEGVNVISWMSSPDLWGVAIVEADTMEQVVSALAVWRAAVPGFFKLTKTSPAVSIQEIIPIAAAANQAVNG